MKPTSHSFLFIAIVLFVATCVASSTGQADPLFLDPVHYPTGNGAMSVAISHLDGDHILDLAVSNPLSDDVSILIGNGDGTFQIPANYL